MKIETPFRADHTYLQHLDGHPDDIFPLLCPVRETEWVQGWNPQLVISETGFAELSCVFTTVDEFGTSTWFVSSYNPEDYHIEFVKFTPAYFVVLIEIRLRAGKTGMTTAECRYQYTAISETGREFVAGFTIEAYETFMKEWESELNHFLETGRKTNEGSVAR